MSGSNAAARVLCLMVAALALAGCGGGSSSTSSVADYTVGGTVSGLNGTLGLQDNGTDTLTVSADGSFTFTTALPSGGAYDVTVSSQPTGQACTVANGSGTVSAAVSNVTVSCATSNTLTGTAASGDPLAGATVTLKDQNGNTRTATTAGDGAFSVNVTGLTAPFLLEVVSGSTTYYSASAAPASSNPTANVDQYTDLALRGYYAALNGSDISTVFADVSAATVMPDQTDLNNLASTLNNVLQPTLADDGVASAASFNIFTTTFTANDTGFDALLHDTTYTSASSPTAAASYAISTPGANGETLTESGTVTVSTGQIDLSNTNTDATNGTTTASSSSFSTVGVAATSAQQQSDEQAAVTGIQSTWAALVATAQAAGSGLTASDLAPYFDANFLQQGLNAAAYESYLAEQLMAYVGAAQGSGSIGQVYAFSDPAGGPIQITAQSTVNVGAGAGSYSVDVGPIGASSVGQGLSYIQESDGSYRLYGNQVVGAAEFGLQTKNSYSANQPITTSTSLVLVALAPFATPPVDGAGAGVGTVSGVTIANTGGNSLLPDCTGTAPYALNQTGPLSLSEFLVNGNAPVDNVWGEQFELFIANACEATTTIVPVTTFPPVGTQYQLTYDEASGVTQPATLTMNGLSSETLQLLGINDATPSAFLNGGPVAGGESLTFSWPLPTTFAVHAIQISVASVPIGVITGNSNVSTTAITQYLSPTATSGTVVLPVYNAESQTTVGVTIYGNDGEVVTDSVTFVLFP